MIAAMLTHHGYGSAAGFPSAQQRFLTSAANAIAELRKLVLDSPRPFEAGTGGQIAQMLSAIREAASNFDFADIVRCASRIEDYVLSSATFGPAGALRNVVLGSKLEALSRHVLDAEAGGHVGAG
jgi:hypothetical protein